MNDAPPTNGEVAALRRELALIWESHAREHRLDPAQPGAAVTAHLTPAEWDVLHLIGLGMSSKMAAVVRGVNEQQIKNIASRINRKLGTGSRIGALRAVGWLQVPVVDWFTDAPAPPLVAPEVAA